MTLKSYFPNTKDQKHFSKSHKELLHLKRTNRAVMAAGLPWILVSLVMALIPLIGYMPVWILGIFILCATWRQFAEIKHWPLPNKTLRTMLFIVMLGAVFISSGGIALFRDPNSLNAFLVALISLKLFELETERDFMLVALLDYVLILSCFFNNQSLAQTLYVFIIILINTIGIIRCYSNGLGSHSRAFSTTNIKTKQPTKATLVIALILLVETIPLTIGGFLLFPRFEGHFFRRFNLSQKGVTGISDHLDPGSISDIEQTQEVAFRASFPNGDGTRIPSQFLYWRALTLGINEGLSWSVGRPQGASYSPPSTLVPPSANHYQLKQIVQHIDTKPTGQRWLFALDYPIKSLTKGTFIDPATGGISASNPLLSEFSYDVISEIQPSFLSHNTTILLPPSNYFELPAQWKNFYLTSPRNLSPKIAQFAALLRQQNPNDKQLIEAILNYYKNNGFTYTLNPGVFPKGQDGLEYFFFQKRSGFCEHYAAATAALLRACHIPARVAVGYQGGLWNPYFGGHYTVRQSDAHAWTEAWIDGLGWQKVDPTAVIASDRLLYGAQSYAALGDLSQLTEEERLARINAYQKPNFLKSLLTSAQLGWDSAEEQWNLNVVDFDASAQRQMWSEYGMGNFDDNSHVSKTIMIVVGIVIGGVIYYLLFKNIRFSFFAKTPPQNKASRLYNRFCKQVGSTKIYSAHLPSDTSAKKFELPLRRMSYEGPLDYSKRIKAMLPKNDSQIVKITELYLHLKYGSPLTSEKNLSLLKNLKDEVQRFKVLR